MLDLLQQKDKKVEKAVKKKQMRTAASMDLLNEFTGVQMALEEERGSGESSPGTARRKPAAPPKKSGE